MTEYYSCLMVLAIFLLVLHINLLLLSSVGKRVVNVPSFVVRVDSQKHIDSTAGRPGRAKRKAAKNGGGGGDGGDEDFE